MNDIPEPTTQRPTRQLQFSLSTMLLLIAIICVTVSHVITSRELSNVRRELKSASPLPAREVARQFQENTTLGPISVTVKDVRYSPDADSYKVDFSWTNATTNKVWSSDVKLSADGYGAYHGQIRNRPFIAPLGIKEAFTVSVKSPSPLNN